MSPPTIAHSAFLLDNGNAYHAAHALGMIEHVLEEAYFPPHWRKQKQSSVVILLGKVMGLCIGQACGG